MEHSQSRHGAHSPASPGAAGSHHHLSRANTRMSTNSVFSIRSGQSLRPPSVAPSMVEIARALEAETTLPASTSIDDTKLDSSHDVGGEKLTRELTQSSHHDKDDELPNGGYGWVIMFCLLGLNACTWGVNTTYGVFSSYFLEFNYYNSTQLDYAWVGGVSAAVAVMQGPLANFLVRRFGIHIPMILGTLGVGLGQIGAGFSKSFGPFIICQGFVFGVGMGLILVPSQPILAHWFDRRLSFAQGISQAGSGVGALIFCNTTPLLLHSLGVKYTYVINGCISMAVLLPSVLLMRGRHKALGARSAPFQLNFFWHPGFKYMLMWAFLTMMGYFIAIYTLASFCTNALGLTQKQGGAVQSILAAGQVIGRPIWGILLDRGGRTNMVIVSYLIAGVVTLTMWMLGRSFAVMAIYALICGATSGTIHSASTPLAASVVGLADLGSSLSIYWMTLAIPNLFAQAFAIMLVDYSRSHLHRTGPDAYAISIGFCGGLFLAAALALIGVKHYLQNDWKVFKKS